MGPAAAHPKDATSSHSCDNICGRFRWPHGYDRLRTPESCPQTKTSIPSCTFPVPTSQRRATFTPDRNTPPAAATATQPSSTRATNRRTHSSCTQPISLPSHHPVTLRRGLSRRRSKVPRYVPRYVPRPCAGFHRRLARTPSERPPPWRGPRQHTERAGGPPAAAASHVILPPRTNVHQRPSSPGARRHHRRGPRQRRQG